MPIPASLRERGNTSDHTVDAAPDSDHKKTEHTDHTFLDPLFEWLGRDLAGTAAPSTNSSPSPSHSTLRPRSAPAAWR